SGTASPHPVATVHARGRRFSLIWAIPVVTALIGGWLAWDTLARRGPLVSITFLAAEGLQAGQSHVRHKDVDMGLVQSIALSKDRQRVVVKVRMNSAAEPLLTDTARFWVVKPRFFAGSISGLETLLSGAYIELLPGAANGAPEREFVGLEDPPVLQSDVPGSTFLLHAARIGSISLGSPVFYRDLDVGQVLGWDIADMADSVTVHAFVRAPFDRYVHDGSQFWNASGASLQLGPNGVQLQLESLRALALGGVAFDTPAEARSTPISAANHNFALYADREAAQHASFTERIRCVAYFAGSAAGLATDAQVTLRGLQIGAVSSVYLWYDKAVDRVLVAVRFDVEPQRISQLQLPGDTNLVDTLRILVHRGLRASIGSSNLLTGQKEVALIMQPDAPAADLSTDGDTFVLPTVDTGGLDNLAQSASAIMAKLDRVPFEQIGQNLNETLSGANKLANDQQLHDAVAKLQSTLTEVQALVHAADTGIQPVLQKLPQLAQGLDDAVRRTNRLLGSVDTGYGGDSKFNRDADRLMLQLTDTARSLRVLADLLARHPEALIRGRTDQGPE
ncbi:MAG TPA: MlaD family protein, partial [Acetobacteraceae bacterium]|nr:MlaD family protein [Acetobacteraceae bacterium]